LTIPFGLRLKKTTEVPEPTSALGLIHKLADKGLSFRSKVVAEQLKLTRTFPDDYDLDGALTRMIQRAQEAGKSKDVLTVLQTCQRTIFRIDP
jgi:hypothetical protein